MPSSVPASYGNRSISSRDSHCAWASSRDRPETPTNQSGLGPIIESRVTRGWSLVTVTSNVALPLPPPPTPFLMTETAFELALISDWKVDVEPSSATFSTPVVAVPPGAQKVTMALCTAPISVVKCAPPTTPSGVLAVVQLPWNVTV